MMTHAAAPSPAAAAAAAATVVTTTTPPRTGPLTNGALAYTDPSGVQLRNRSQVKIGLGSSPGVIRAVRNRWSANLESVKGFMTGGDLRTSDEAQKQETIMKSVVNCIHKVT